MKTREVLILFGLLFALSVGIVIGGGGFNWHSGGWPSPNGPPSQQLADAACQMIKNHAARAERHIPDETRVAYWWQEPRVPEYFDPFFSRMVDAESLVRIDSLNSDGEIYHSNWVFLRWNGQEPYCVAIIADENHIPEKYR